MTNTISIFLIFLRLGLTSFGGPLAHLGYFREAFVGRRKWLSEEAYLHLVSLCQFLPGPSSSQVAIGLGLRRGGLAGGLAAWFGFTLPSAAIMISFGLGLRRFETFFSRGAIHGLKIVAVAVVGQAVWSMIKTFCTKRWQATCAAMAAAMVLLRPDPTSQIGALILGGCAGFFLMKPQEQATDSFHCEPFSQKTSIISLILFAAFLSTALLLPTIDGSHSIVEFFGFFRSGALVFGGGHVVLPLLEAEMVPRGWVTKDAFLAGYAVAQALPGPLFSFAAYLGAISSVAPSGIAGGCLGLIGIYFPGFLLVVGLLPFWDQIRKYRSSSKILSGVHAAVVGLLLAAFYQPVWTSALYRSSDFVLLVGALLLLIIWRLPPWIVILSSAIAGHLLADF